jgi:hypothetical protein
MWSRIYQQLSCISNIKVERLVTGSARRTSLQLHGFCDASIIAYGACIYIRSTDEEGNLTTRLLCSKSRVAPLRQVSLPRPELCGAVLLVNLVHKTMKALETNINSVHLWTDSTIVLAWLAAPATRWKVYVANRVAEIQRLMEIEAATWKHVSSENNPADIISRGVYPIDFQECQIWWQGPNWLSEAESSWPVIINKWVMDIPEQRITTVTLHTQVEDDNTSRFSSFGRLQRVIAYCLRFVHNAMKHAIKNT